MMSIKGTSFEINIPGIRYSARIRHSTDGKWKVAVILGADEMGTVDLKTASRGGIRSALAKALKIAEITHQVPEMVLNNLARDLSRQMQKAGVVEDEEGTIGAPAEELGETVKRINEKLEEIVQIIEQLELRLSRVEDRLGF